jgi:hypothetical protein
LARHSSKLEDWCETEHAFGREQLEQALAQGTVRDFAQRSLVEQNVGEIEDLLRNETYFEEDGLPGQARQ